MGRALVGPRVTKLYIFDIGGNRLDIPSFFKPRGHCLSHSNIHFLDLIFGKVLTNRIFGHSSRANPIGQYFSEYQVQEMNI